jgi:predicted Zn-dependent peptidase
VIDQTTVDGVETLFVRTAGPMRAGLTFRVGRADEPLYRSGITHLTEHLALFHLNLADYHFNGATGAVTTDFHLQGSADDITGYLAGVCEALTDLPLSRLEVEKEILRTEENSRSGSVMQPFALWRYGARGFGLLSYPEWGLSMIGPDDLRAWVARYFTKENAVLWVAGPDLPPGLRLPLPSGVRQAVPAPTSALPTTPAYFFGESTNVAIEAIVRRGPAVGVFTGVLERELFRALRQENGLSYTAAAISEPRGDGYSRVVALADALPDKQQAVLGGVIDVLAKLRVGRIDPADIAAAIGKAEDEFAAPDIDAVRLPAAAFNQLTGYPNRPIEQLLADLRAVTVAEVHQVAQEVSKNALLMVPCETVGPSWAGFEAAPTRSSAAVTGTSYRFINSDDQSIVIGADGVSLVTKDGVATVRYAECAAMLSWPDGARHLMGYDSIGVRIEPTLLAIHPDALRYIDSLVPAAAHVRRPARDPDAIPKPRPKPPTAAVPPPAPPLPRRRGEVVLMAIFGVAAVVFGCAALLGTAGVGSDAQLRTDGGTWAVVGCVWVVTVLLVLPFVVLWRKRPTS